MGLPYMGSKLAASLTVNLALEPPMYLPYAASQCIAALEQECRIPVHLDVHVQVSRLNTQLQSILMYMYRSAG